MEFLTGRRYPVISMVDKELVSRAKKDPQAFGQIYDQYYPQIFGYILKRTGNLEAAKDITSETFFKALKKLWQFRWLNVPFSSWLYRIAGNEIINHFRKNGRQTVPLDDIAEPPGSCDLSEEMMAAEEELQRHKDFLAIQKKITALSVKYQEVITLRFLEKKKIKEIGEILGKKEGTVKSLLNRGLAKLREIE